MNLQYKIFNNFDEINENDLNQNISVLCMNSGPSEKKFTTFLRWTKKCKRKPFFPNHRVQRRIFKS